MCKAGVCEIFSSTKDCLREFCWIFLHGFTKRGTTRTGMLGFPGKQAVCCIYFEPIKGRDRHCRVCIHVADPHLSHVSVL